MTKELFAKYRELNKMLLAEIKKAEENFDKEEVEKLRKAFYQVNESFNTALGY